MPCRSHQPARYDDRLLYWLSIAFSKFRIVSKGRSKRGRVGLVKSGSAVSLGQCLPSCRIHQGERHTNDIAVGVAVLHASQALERRLFVHVGH